jgi:hypothetical protein
LSVQEEGQQHIELLQEYTNVLEGFGKRFGILSNVQVRIQLKIKHITGLRDGVSRRSAVVPCIMANRAEIQIDLDSDECRGQSHCLR